MFAATLFFYGQLPDRVASHWSIRGEVDGYMGRFWGAFLIPLMTAALMVVFKVIPRIDPLRKNIESFKEYYYGFVLVLALFLAGLQLQILLWNVGVKVSPSATMPFGIGMLFLYLGYLLNHTKRNWFVGIRTPWTLSSDRVWDKTHEKGSVLFKASGAIALVGALFPDQSIWFILVPVLASTAYLFIYSYLEYQKERKPTSP